jgi:hypothetical protein
MRQKPVGEPAATAALNFGTPRRRSSWKRLGPFCHCRQRYRRSLRRLHAARLVSTRGVWQKPKQPRHPRRYGASSLTSCGRLIPRVRRVRSRICALNLPRAVGAMRLSLPSFDQNEVDVSQGRVESRLVVPAVVVDPTPDMAVEHPGQVVQRLVAALVKRPASDRLADRLESLVACRGAERDAECTPPPSRQPRPECVAEKIELLVGVVSAPVIILAIDDFRLFRMKRYTKSR